MQNINLIPQKYLLREEQRKQTAFAILILGIFVLLAAANYSLLFLRSGNYIKVRVLVDDKSRKLGAMHSELQHKLAEVESLRKEEQIMAHLLKGKGGKVLLRAV